MDHVDIRDLRDGKFLWIDKAALKLVSEKIGNCGVAVYAWLCHYANSKNQNCFPSITTLSHHCHVTRRTIMSTIKRLEKLKLIFIEREPGKLNTYKLLNVLESKTSVSHFTSEKRDTRVVSPISPVLVKPETPEQELIDQELFNNKAGAASEEKIKELKILCTELLLDINLYPFMQSFKNARGYPPPLEMMIDVCKRFKKDKSKIKNVWGWFTRVVDAESAQFFAEQNIKEHKQLKNEPATVGRILSQIVAKN